MENSAAYHQAGNLLVEKTVDRYKNAIGMETIDNARPKLLSLNLVAKSGEAKKTILSPPIILLTVTKWLSGSTSDSYECMASYLGLGFESIWGVTMRLAKYAEKPQSQPVLEL